MQGMAMKQTKPNNTMVLAAIAIVTLLVLFNQWQISSMSTMLGGKPLSAAFSAAANKASFAGSGDLKDVDLSAIQNTAQALAATMPIDKIKTDQDAVDLLIPTGTPEYGEAIGGISYDKPVDALNMLARAWNPLSQQIKTEDPETWQRFLALTTKPVGISCEYCCGVGPIGISPDGQSRCGCSHNPAILALTLWLMKNTEMSDAEILREALRWKTLWFPRDMVGMALKLAGGDTSLLDNVPGMVGGC